VSDLDPDDVFAEGDLWAEVISRRDDKDFALLATMPEDPTLN